MRFLRPVAAHARGCHHRRRRLAFTASLLTTFVIPTSPSATATPSRPLASLASLAPSGRTNLTTPAAPATRAVPFVPVPLTSPAIDNYPAAILASLPHPDAPPPGADDWDCSPSPAHPRPVVLLHGTFANAFNAWNAVAPQLKADGYCVFALNYGAPRGAITKATAHIPDSAEELAAYVDRVLAVTGARQVDLVGHSQGGGVLPRWYLRFAGGADARDPARNKVRRLVGINPSNHGTTILGLGTLIQKFGLHHAVGALAGPAVPDQLIGSQVHTTLDRGGDTVPGVAYTTIVSRLDEVATPYYHQYLTPGPGASVHNITLQDVCPIDLAEHIGGPYDPITLQLVRNALDPSTATTPYCQLVLPIIS
ncbi:alpha/beta fold hydrolase [Streptomyces sp. NPDC059788]|uniref:esterase/lipase family protein n=1 Tax=Streptomyces sp. NPDC059788 TaxID=3346948 RepID=UPI003660D6DC